jgi:hypothetical protein
MGSDPFQKGLMELLGIQHGLTLDPDASAKTRGPYAIRSLAGQRVVRREPQQLFHRCIEGSQTLKGPFEKFRVAKDLVSAFPFHADRRIPKKAIAPLKPFPPSSGRPKGDLPPVSIGIIEDLGRPPETEKPRIFGAGPKRNGPRFQNPDPEGRLPLFQGKSKVQAGKSASNDREVPIVIEKRTFPKT